MRNALGPRAQRSLRSRASLLVLVAELASSTGCMSRSRPEPERTSEPPKSSPVPSRTSLNDDDRRMLLKMARSELLRAVKDASLETAPLGLPSSMTEKKGSFVTLTIKGQLRGCIGNIFPDMPLAQAVIHNARSAALEDSRFSPVTADELSAIEIEVSVLSVPQPLKFSTADDLLLKLRPHKDGVVLNFGLRRSTFLPQVWDQLPDPNDFLGHLSVKAGMAHDAWREPGVSVMTYQVEAFKESEFTHG